MSAHVLLNLLKKLKKRDKMRGMLSILSLFSQRVLYFQLYRSTDVRFYLLHDIKMNSKSLFWLENIKILSSLTQRLN